MRFDNLIKLKTWRVEMDKYGSEFKNLNDDIIAVKMKKAKQTEDKKFTYNTVKLYLNDSFDDRIFKIIGFKGFQITYKTQRDHHLVFSIEENMDTYNFFYKLPPSKEWITRIIKINDLISAQGKNLKLNLKNITSFVFSLDSSDRNEIIDTFYIKEFIIKNYEIITIKKSISSISKKYLMKKSILNYFKLFILKNKKEKFLLSDSRGNPLFCLYPFSQFFINHGYYSVCNRISLEENFNFIENSNLLYIWNSEKFDKMRECIRDLSYSECNLSECVEVNKLRNSIKNLKEIKNEYPDIADYLEGNINVYRGYPKIIEVGFDSTCNLTCKSCTVDKASKIPLDIGKRYIQEIEKIGKECEKIVLAGFGEPFASPSYLFWLYNFPGNKFPKLKTIEFFTNGILWTEKKWNQVSDNIKKLDIEAIISIDGVKKESFEYNRGNAKFEILIKNLNFISKLRKNNKIKSFAFRFVVQKNNYKEIPIAIEFAKKYSFDRIYFYPIRNWGAYTPEEFMDVNIFDKKHPEFKNFIKIYKKVKKIKHENLIIDYIFFV